LSPCSEAPRLFHLTEQERRQQPGGHPPPGPARGRDAQRARSGAPYDHLL